MSSPKFIVDSFVHQAIIHVILAAVHALEVKNIFNIRLDLAPVLITSLWPSMKSAILAWQFYETFFIVFGLIGSTLVVPMTSRTLFLLTSLAKLVFLDSICCYVYPQALTPLLAPRPVLRVQQVCVSLLLQRGWFPILKQTRADFCISPSFHHAFYGEGVICREHCISKLSLHILDVLQI